jgi:excisionase family DNA binding protein
VAKPQRVDKGQRAWLTVEEFAQEMGIGMSHARRIIAKGDVPSRKLGRIIRVPATAVLPLAAEHPAPLSISVRRA